MPEIEEIKKTVRDFILKEVFQGPDSKELTDTTPLITGGIMDSISTIQLVDFLEKQFSVQFKPHEVDQDNLNTIELITRCVNSKLVGTHD